MLLALKLLLVPALLAAISLAGRRWGPGVAGWLAGFPSLTGPILFFLAIERGAAFTVPASIFALSAVSAALVFGIAYAWACLRLRWPAAWLCALLAWLAAVAILVSVPPTLAGSLALALGLLLLAPRLFPKPRGQWGASAVPPHELVLRMAAGAGMVLAVTAVAETVGAAWTGVLAVFPVFSSVLAVFSQRANGPGFVVAMLRAMTGGFYAFIAYCVAVALLLPTEGVAATFTVAVAIAVVVQGAARAVMLRLA
ncbi:MAG TPA: hypothetical protein VI229_01625 [Burkholderiales bacterium]